MWLDAHLHVVGCWMHICISGGAHVHVARWIFACGEMHSCMWLDARLHMARCTFCMHFYYVQHFSACISIMFKHFSACISIMLQHFSLCAFLLYSSTVYVHFYSVPALFEGALKWLLNHFFLLCGGGGGLHQGNEIFIILQRCDEKMRRLKN